jgi:multidrug efflux pump
VLVNDWQTGFRVTGAPQSGNASVRGRCSRLLVDSRNNLWIATAGQGLWPAFWMLGNDFPTVGWPASGELDIMENKGSAPNTSSSAIHGPGYSGGQAQQAVTKLLNDNLPKGMSFEWTDLTYQQILAGNTALLVFPLCVLLVFLVLAAQYESLFLPLAIILIVPMCLFSAITGVWLTGGDNNIFTQIGLFVLIGLACKNAILIVEFARELEIQGRSTVAAAMEAARLRLRPILMTSFAFIMGVVPLVISSGAGAEMRHAMGVTVFFGMLGVTFFGLFLTPAFYVLLRALEKTITRTELVHHHV